MARDIYVQDILTNVSEVKDIPSDWMPDPLPYSHSEIVATIQRVVPAADFSDPEWGHIEGENFSIEVNIKREEPMRSFAFHCRANGLDADYVVADILEALSLRAFDIDSETGIFEDPRTRPEGLLA